MNEKNNKIIKAREFCQKVKELAKEYNLSFFVVTEGASSTSNNNCEAVKNARDNHIKWELEHGANPYEDWCFDNHKDFFISEENKEERWDKIHKRGGTRDDIRNQYDDWLEKYPEITKALTECKSSILDLGCGIGIDTLHLVEDGHKVVACDFSQEALNKVQKNIPEAKILRFNMKDSFPFEDELFELIIANKSIHYFSEQETKTIINELYRILKPGGTFIFIVNSTNDSNFGAKQGVRIEDNFYKVRGTTKRFFDKDSLNKFFDKKHWDFICMNEEETQNDRIKAVQLQKNESASKKITWTCMVRKK